MFADDVDVVDPYAGADSIVTQERVLKLIDKCFEGTNLCTYLNNFLNRPFPSSCLPRLQSEYKCEVFLMKISFIHM